MANQTEQSRSVALKFCELIDKKDFDLLSALFTADAKWWVVANTECAHWGGSLPAAEMCKNIRNLIDPFEEWSNAAVGVTTEGERVVVEGVSKGRGPGPLAYDNNYQMRFIIGGGKIKDIKESLDCYEVEMFLESMEKLKAETEGK